MKETTKSIQVPALELELRDLVPEARGRFIGFCSKMGLAYAEMMGEETVIASFDEESLKDNVFIVINEDEKPPQRKG